MTFTLQQQDNDCGVQALITSLRTLGHEPPEARLREALDVRGARSMRELRDAAADVCGVRYRGVRDCPFDTLTAGAVVHLRADHYVTVVGRRLRRVRIFDPASGPGWLDERAYRDRASGWALLPRAADGSAPAPAARPRRVPRFGWLRPLVRAGGFRPRQAVPVLAVSLLLYTGLTLLNLVLMPYLNRTSVGGHGGQVALLVGLALFFVLLSAMFWFRQRQLTTLGLAFDRALINHLVDRVSRTATTTETSSGSLLHRVMTVREVREGTTALALSVFTNACAVVILMGFMVSMSLPLSAVVAALAVGHIGLTTLARRPIVRHYDERLRLEGEVQDILITLTRGLSTFRGLGATGHLRATHEHRLDQLNAAIRTLQFRLSWISGPTEALRFVGLYAILLVGSVLVGTGAVSTGELFGFLTMGGTVMFAVVNIAESLPATAQMERQLRYVATLLDLPVVPAGTHTDPLPGAPAVVLRDVRVHRPRDGFDLRLDLRIERGETVTVGGASGVGKSTMARIVCGLDPTPAGRAEAYGVPVADWDPDRLRPMVCYVPPRSDFARTTLRDSLCSGVDDITDAELDEVLRLFELEEVLRPLRLGLRTTLQVDGGTFSAGEVQRFALARALLRQPSLLILDEATNSLDRAMELRLLRAVQQRVETLVVVSHRPVAAHLGSRHLVIERDGDGVSRLVPGDD
ncbi:ATP-binding cassette domain-containing protein [Micromonospora sp. NPDC047074]|uniref:ATP-binding cassette domain-containing protein n=1 Tax=Micromonospora sp. NPDC047074 TaxID=3154339 RepID=UPI0033CEC5BF